MRIYTRTGDQGETGLIGGSRVTKADPRVEAYGTVDELNALLGLAAVHATEPTCTMLRTIQTRLFDVGALLATPPDVSPAAGVARVDRAWIAELESDIDRMSETLPPLRSFILPGGDESAAWIHLARTVCRRAERRVVALPLATVWDGDAIAAWLNRLSDWLFVAARYANYAAGVEDVLWHPPTGTSTI